VEPQVLEKCIFRHHSCSRLWCPCVASVLIAILNQRSVVVVAMWPRLTSPFHPHGTGWKRFCETHSGALCASVSKWERAGQLMSQDVCMPGQRIEPRSSCAAVLCCAS
jgi:hypothetical protein